MPTMRTIFYTGIREIMIVSLLLIICGYVANFIYNHHEAKKAAE